MNKDQFQDLLNKYTAGQCTAEEAREVDQWFKDIADTKLALEPEKLDEERLKILKRIVAQMNRNKVVAFRVSVAWKVAASVSIFLLAGYFFYTDKQNEITFTSEGRQHADGKMVVFNDGKSVQQILLPDSSTAALNPGTKLSYDKIWDGAVREVNLVGEAFFDVRKNPEKPFFVYSGSVVTSVLGTSFSILAPAEAKSIEVMVRTGKVSVYDNTSYERDVKNSGIQDGVILMPNEKVKYFLEDKQWVTGLVDKPQPLITENRERDFIFNDTPLNEIIKHVSEYYQIEVIIDTEDALNCSFTGDVAKLELHDMLTIVCESIGAHYEVKGSRILITGNGCK